MSNKPVLKIELCAENELDRQQWLGNVNTCIQSASSGLTPITKYLKERAKKLSLHHDASVEKMDAEISERQDIARRVSKRMDEVRCRTLLEIKLQ